MQTRCQLGTVALRAVPTSISLLLFHLPAQRIRESYTPENPGISMAATRSGSYNAGLCHFLHITLILVYIALVVVASRHYEHGLDYPFTSAGQTLLFATVSVVAQTFSTVSPFAASHYPPRACSQEYLLALPHSSSFRHSTAFTRSRSSYEANTHRDP